MAVETITRQTKASFTLTLASLASSTAGVGRQSTLVSNSGNYPAAQGYIKFKLGTSPTAGVVVAYLVQADDSTPTCATDNAGASDASITILSAKPIGSTPTKASPATGDVVTIDFDTAAAGVVLAPYWGIAVVHTSGVNANGTEANFAYEYQYYQRSIA